MTPLKLGNENTLKSNLNFDDIVWIVTCYYASVAYWKSDDEYIGELHLTSSQSYYWKSDGEYVSELHLLSLQ